MRFRFSLRSAAVFVAALCAVLALVIRLTPLVIWKTRDAEIANGVLPDPVLPLVVPAPKEPYVRCRIGGMSLRLPEAMSKNMTVERGKITFSDTDRVCEIKSPQLHPDLRRLNQGEFVEFPELADWTFPRLDRAILQSSSNDFSWTMSHHQLRFHQHLLYCHMRHSRSWWKIEYVTRADIDANLGFIRFHEAFYDWATADAKFYGLLDLRDRSENFDWARILADSFTIEGDPRLPDVSDAKLLAMVHIEPLDEPARDAAADFAGDGANGKQ